MSIETVIHWAAIIVACLIIHGAMMGVTGYLLGRIAMDLDRKDWESLDEEAMKALVIGNLWPAFWAILIVAAPVFATAITVVRVTLWWQRRGQTKESK